MDAKESHCTSLSKRTRVVKKGQSKSGCFTCKDRRVKCDEAKPTCQRCTKADLICQGYSLQSPSTSSHKRSDDQCQSATIVRLERRQFETSFPCSDEEYKSRIYDILSSSGSRLPGSDALKLIINANSTVLASSILALTLLESLVFIDAASRLEISKDNDLYTLAVSHLRREIDLEQKPMLLFVTCILLQATELLQRRRQNGLKHGIAALELVRKSSSSVTIDNHLIVLLQTIDLQYMLFSDGVRVPVLEPDRSMKQGTAFEHRGIAILHRCHSFIAAIYQCAVSGGRVGTTAELSAYQSQLDQYRQELTMEIAKHRDLRAASICLIMENLCIMTAMQLQLLHSCHETDWDGCFTSFAAIIENANVLLAGITLTSPRFTLLIGLIPPLLLVALKCRFQVLRKRAIDLVRQTGCEGPFIGAQFAAMAERCMEIEEGQNVVEDTAALDKSEAIDTTRSTSDLPIESRRIAKCALLDANGLSDPALLPQAHSGETIIKFLRRRQPCSLILAHACTSAHHRPDVMSALHQQKLATEDWEFWTENLRYGRDTSDQAAV